MEQHITKEQWDKLKKTDKELFWEELNYWYNDLPSNERIPTIGQMIEFLGDDLVYIDFEQQEVILKSTYTRGNDEVNGNKWTGCFTPIFHWGDRENKELVDALWEAARNKLAT